MERVIHIEPELGVPLAPDATHYDLRQRAEAACKSIKLLEEHGLDTENTQEDKETAAAITKAYAADPTKTSKTVNTARAALLTPESLKNIRAYLDEYGRAVVTKAIEIRHTVTNRLLEESRNPDPRVRIRALELLGKVSDVGLFTDRSEVTITHQTTDEVRERLREKLQRLIKPSDDSPYVVEMDNNIVDVDEELGIKVKYPHETPANPHENPPKTDE